MDELFKEDWINHDITLDFPIPRDIQEELDYLEELNTNRDCAYFARAEDLDDFVKEAVRQHHLTHKQWDLIMARYHL